MTFDPQEEIAALSSTAVPASSLVAGPPPRDPQRCPLIEQLLRPPVVVPAYLWDVFAANFPDPAQWLTLNLEQPRCPADRA